MKLPFRHKRHRGKGKSAEQKFREKKAKVDSFLLDTWLKQLKNDPALAARISEQKYGSEVTVAYGQDGEYAERPDLLEVLRQAREAKDLIRDEIGEGKGSTIRDIAEIVKALPGVLQSLGQANLSQLQNPQLTQPRIHQIASTPKQEQPKPQRPDFSEVKLEVLMALLELEPEHAWLALQNQGETGWVNFLKTTSYEQLVENLNGLAAMNPEYKEHINAFLKEFHVWLQNLITIAHKDEAK